MRSRILAILLLCLLSVSSAFAQNSESLGHYGVMTLASGSAEAALQGRFKGKGRPLFLVHEVRLGVAAGDIIRFEDKAVLVDATVMQTLQATGALQALKQAPVLRLQAKSQSGVWQSRSTLVQNAREQKAYRLGGEVLKVFEDYFGKAPSNEEIVLRFAGKDLEMLVPDVLIDHLSFATVRKVTQTKGKPLLISAAPTARWFKGDSLLWRVWGVEPGSPDAELRYGIVGELPLGLEWSDSLHGIVGHFDSAGVHHFTVFVRNQNGASDSLSVSLTVVMNQPPRFLKDPAPIVIPGAAYQWVIPVVDPDHAYGQLRCTSAQGAKPFHVDSLCELTGSPDLNWSGPDSMLVFVQDPRGAKDSLRVILNKSQKVPSPLHAIRFLLPKDTLVQGQVHEWGVHNLLTDGIQLVSVEGFDSVKIIAGKDPVLRMCPMHAGTSIVNFHLVSGSDSITLAQRLFILGNRPPEFRSALSAYEVQEGTRLLYKPVAVDSDGDSVTLSAEHIDGGEKPKWEGNSIPLWTQSPGTFSMDLYASDGINPSVSQRISWTVQPDRKEWIGVSSRMLTVESADYWWLDFHRGAARFGFFTPKLGEVVSPNTSMQDHEWPFLFAGASLLGERGLARGDWFYIDFGLQLRNPTARLVTGGFMTGVDGHWTSSSKAHPWVFEMEVNVHSNQAIIVIDTTGWKNTPLIVKLNASNQTLSLGSLNTDSLMNQLFGPVYSKIVKDVSAKDNTVAVSRFEGFVPTISSNTFGTILLGAVVWREDYLNGVDLNQWAGLSIRHQAEWSYFNLTQTIRFGLFSGGKHDGFIRYDLQMNLGVWH